MRALLGDVVIGHGEISDVASGASGGECSVTVVNFLEALAVWEAVLTEACQR